MEIRCAEQDPQRPEREADVAINENRPQPTKCNQSAERGEGQAEQHAREVDAQLRHQTIERVLPIGQARQVEALGAVMHRMKAPQEREMMAGAMEPVC